MMGYTFVVVKFFLNALFTVIYSSAGSRSTPVEVNIKIRCKGVLKEMRNVMYDASTGTWLIHRSIYIIQS